MEHIYEVCFNVFYSIFHFYSIFIVICRSVTASSSGDPRRPSLAGTDWASKIPYFLGYVSISPIEMAILFHRFLFICHNANV